MTSQDPLPNFSDLPSPLTLPEADSERLARAIAQAAEDRKAADITLLKVDEVSYLTDYFVIITGFSRIQVRSISEAIEEVVARDFHQRPLRVEGKAEGSWILQDYGDVIAHIFLPQEREFYNLEAFWGHGQAVEWESANSASR